MRTLQQQSSDSSHQKSEVGRGRVGGIRTPEHLSPKQARLASAELLVMFVCISMVLKLKPSLITIQRYRQYLKNARG